MAEFLLELFSEEIPARMQAAAAEQLRASVTARLAEERLEFSRAEAFVTPRRLALVVDGLPQRQPDVVEERKGPHVGAPQRALEGFMKSAGLATLDGAEVRTVGGADYYYLSRNIPGRGTAEVLRDVVTAVIESFAWPKSMRWGSGTMRWVRPLQNILCIFDRAVVDVALRDYDLRANDVTYGHRFHAPDPIAVASFEEYARKLRDAHVVLDARERRTVIAERIAALAAAEGLRVADDPALLDEVSGLVEWPVPLAASVDEQFMNVPREVLTATMRANQKYFALETADGALAPRFIVVANIDAKDGGAAVVAGNERVLRARLSDAKFFWEQDLKTPLAERVPKLNNLVFHAKLGTIGDKAQRLEQLAPEIAQRVRAGDSASSERLLVDRVELPLVGRAGLLCKADLVSGMVGEFPELQGKMGRYYALADGEDPRVADAIGEHYAPLGPNDRCPSAPFSVAVALADKLDTLVGFFAVGEKPTGSRDPFALRRAALGVIRLIVENRLRAGLAGAITFAHNLYAKQQPAFVRDAGTAPGELAAELLDFFADRLKVYLRERGVRHDLISAVFSLRDEDDLVRLLARVDALSTFLASPDGANLLSAYKRASNIVRVEERKDKQSYDGPIAADLLQQQEEKQLDAELKRATNEIAEQAAREDFAGAMGALARLRPFVDVFFDEVTVNADDPALRANRLRLLSGIRSAPGAVADFSKIEG
ncbi:MAG: glycyl-tRNA synthetase beta chain [Candidatus Eremiobacteraeota bacterium]|jgi:glycyl-tRNA synthetase beta chain|nr:glycyl-tRNA synthetase beta chain [Candidatus Eremiobacteraeota bacterium]